MATISGQVSSMVQPIPKHSWAPAWLQVPMIEPGGSTISYSPLGRNLVLLQEGRVLAGGTCAVVISLPFSVAQQRHGL
jgi:hypothetical protein